MLQNIDREKFRNTKPYHIVQYRAEKTHEQFMEKESVTTKAQIFRCLLVSKKLRESWSLLGIQNKSWNIIRQDYTLV